jgi:hypothetical protein
MQGIFWQSRLGPFRVPRGLRLINIMFLIS